jgi:molybdopterin molybdotransferase
MALMPVTEALQRVLAGARALPSETVALNDALGRVLTQDVVALRTQPPAAVSAMDGYAVRSADVGQAPVTLKLIGEVAAGHPFDGKVGEGQAARIFTGGMMPDGADTVVIQEDYVVDPNYQIGETLKNQGIRRAAVILAQRILDKVLLVL